MAEIRAIRVAANFLRELRETRTVGGIISGMALGWDQALAEASLMLQIPLICYLPCRNMSKPWPTEAHNRWVRIINRAERVCLAVKDDYPGPWCMQKRNEMMADDCDLLLACWDGTSGGTANCLGYAKRKRPDLEIVNLWAEHQKMDNLPKV